MSSIKKPKIYRLLAFILSVALIAGALSACGKPTGFSANTSRPDDSAPEETSEDSDEPSTEPASEEPPLPESQLFASGIRQVLLSAVEKSDSLTSSQLDLLLNPGMQLQPADSDYTKAVITLTNPEEGGESLTISMESILDASNGDASTEIGIQSGSEVAQSAGVYFVGDTMLIKSANVEKQMIQHTLDPAVAESLQTLPALARYTRVLESSAEAKPGESEWNGAIDTFMEALLSRAEESDFTPSEETVTLAGSEVVCATSTLELAGEQAAAVTRDFAELIREDATFRSYFVTGDGTGEDTYAVTGLDGVLRDLDTLPQDGLTMKLKLIQTDAPIGLRIYTATEQTSFFMELLFFEDGYTRQNSIAFQGFDGSSVTMQDTNINTGGDSYEGRISYATVAPGKIPQENTTVTTRGTIGDGGAELAADISYYRAATGDEEATEISGSIDYVQEKAADGTKGSSSGTLAFTSSGETSNISCDMTVEQSGAAAKVNAPEFLPAAGISTSDEAGLFAALGEIDQEEFSHSPATTRTLGTLLLLFV